MSEHEFEIGPHTAPGLHSMTTGVLSALLSTHDPENTLQVALTNRDLGLIAFGITLCSLLFPEMRPALRDLHIRLAELAEFQQFLPDD